MTSPEPGPPELTVTPADALNPMLAPTAGVRSWVDAPRQYERGRPPGVDRDVETHASCATCTDPGEGDQLLDASGDPRLALSFHPGLGRCSVPDVESAPDL